MPRKYLQVGVFEEDSLGGEDQAIEQPFHQRQRLLGDPHDSFSAAATGTGCSSRSSRCRSWGSSRRGGGWWIRFAVIEQVSGRRSGRLVAPVANELLLAAVASRSLIAPALVFGALDPGVAVRRLLVVRAHALLERRHPGLGPRLDLIG